MRFAVTTDSWHYRYFSYIRNGFGFYTGRGTSLCPYCQTILWGTVFLIVMFPVLALGALAGRFWRRHYSRSNHWMSAYYLEKEEAALRNQPFLYYFMNGGIALGALLLAMFVLLLLTLGVTAVWRHLSEIPGAILENALTIGYCFVHVAGTATGDLIEAFWGAASYLAILENFFFVMKIVGYGIGMVMSGYGLYYLISRTPIPDMAIDAHEYINRNAYIEIRKGSWLDKYVIDPLINFCVYMYYSNEVDDGKGGKRLVMSPCRIVYEVCKAAKHSVCPMVDFVQVKDYPEGETKLELLWDGYRPYPRNGRVSLREGVKWPTDAKGKVEAARALEEGKPYTFYSSEGERYYRVTITAESSANIEAAAASTA